MIFKKLGPLKQFKQYFLYRHLELELEKKAKKMEIEKMAFIVNTGIVYIV